MKTWPRESNAAQKPFSRVLLRLSRGLGSCESQEQVSRRRPFPHRAYCFKQPTCCFNNPIDFPCFSKTAGPRRRVPITRSYLLSVFLTSGFYAFFFFYVALVRASTRRVLKKSVPVVVFTVHHWPLAEWHSTAELFINNIILHYIGNM